MNEHQILGILVVFQGILTVAGILLTIQVYREARDSTQKLGGGDSYLLNIGSYN